MSKTQLTKPEYALLTVAVAQKLAGGNKTPTARQFGEAERQAKDAILRRGLGVKGGTASADRLFSRVRADLSGISGMGDDELGGLWDKLKNIVSKAAPVAPFVNPSMSLAVPITKMLLAQQQTKKPAAPKVAENEAEDDVHVVGAASITDTYTKALNALSMGDDDDDMIVFGEGGGMSELGAARRQRQQHRQVSPTMMGVTPIVYRMAVMQRAGKISGGRPTTKHLFLAQKSVDKDLAQAGAAVRIPGAQPGRVTR